jgi:hypothetical protein
MLSDSIILVVETKLLTVFDFEQEFGEYCLIPRTSVFGRVKSLHSFLSSILALSSNVINGAALFADFGMNTAE